MEWIAANQALLIGVVFMLVLGPAVGNYACSVVFRLPRGQTPFERHPYCGHCGSDLKPIDLFPIVSWCLAKGRCRYCRGPVPSVYTWIEVACAVLFVGNFLAFGMDERFLLATAYGVFVIILAAIQWQQGWISSSIYSYALLSAAMLMTLIDGSIFGWVRSAVIMLVGALAWQRLYSALTRNDFRPLDTPWIWWMVLMAALVPIGWWRLLEAPAITLIVFRLLPLPWRRWVLVPITAMALALPIQVFA